MSVHPTASCSDSIDWPLQYISHDPTTVLLTSSYHHSVRLENHNLPVGTYGVYRNGVLTETKFVDRPGDTLEVYVRVEGIDFDLVLLKA